MQAASGHTVLIVDDDETVREVVTRYLLRDGHRVIERANGPDGLAAALTEHPDLVILDLMLPGMDGLAVCRELRRQSAVPVIMLTALGEESDRVVGLEYGADDYLVKPFSPRELALRVAGVLRRAAAGQANSALSPAGPAGDVVGVGVGVEVGVGVGEVGVGIGRQDGASTRRQLRTDGDLRLDLTARTAGRAGQPLALTVREFDLLAYFLEHRGQVFTRAELMERVWGWTFGDQSTVTVHVRRLREKIEPDPGNPRRVATVWGIGYRYDGADPPT